MVRINHKLIPAFETDILAVVVTEIISNCSNRNIDVFFFYLIRSKQPHIRTKLNAKFLVKKFLNILKMVVTEQSLYDSLFALKHIYERFMVSIYCLYMTDG